MIYRKENATTASWALTPLPPPPSNTTLKNCGVVGFFLTIAVSIELLCGHCTDVCSLIRCDFFPPR